MSNQTSVITQKNHPRPLEVLGDHAAVLASGAGEMIHRLKEDVRSWYELHRRNGATNVVVWAIYVELLLMLVLLVLLPFDTVQVGGRYRLIKPLNFTMSMAMYLATVVILLDYLRASMWWKKVIGWGVSICLLTAITCITMQAARGTTSHFNNSTPFRLRRLLGDGHSGPSQWRLCPCPANLCSTGQVRCLAVISTRDRIRAFPFPCRFRHRGVMVAQGQSVVGVAPGGPGLPVVNWSTTRGDFRVAHFLGIHALQILPIAGWLIGQMEGLPRRARAPAVVAVSAGYVLLMGIVLLQAMNGVPLARM